MDDQLRRDYLEKTIAKIRDCPSFAGVEQAAKKRGYTTKFEGGEFEHDGQIDLFISYNVLDSEGEIVDTFDDGFLTAYEPLMIKTKWRKWKIVQSGYDEFIDDLKLILEILQRLSFVAAKEASGKPMASSADGDFSIQYRWSEHGREMAIIDANPDRQTSIPSIGDCLTIEGATYRIIKLA